MRGRQLRPIAGRRRLGSPGRGQLATGRRNVSRPSVGLRQSGPKLIRAELIRTVLIRAELIRTVLIRAELIRTELIRAELIQAELIRRGLRWPAVRRGGPFGVHQPVGVDRLADGRLR